MSKKQNDRFNVESSTELSRKNDYAPPDVASYTEMTGAVPAPPLTDAETEAYGDIVSMPQQRADHAGRQTLRKSKRDVKL
jgi:hypothetical protein